MASTSHLKFLFRFGDWFSVAWDLVTPPPHIHIHLFLTSHRLKTMARGQQKIQAQQKNAKKSAEKKKGQAADQKTAAKAALVHTCPVCRVSAASPRSKTWKPPAWFQLKAEAYSVHTHSFLLPIFVWNTWIVSWTFSQMEGTRAQMHL